MDIRVTSQDEGLWTQLWTGACPGLPSTRQVDACFCCMALLCLSSTLDLGAELPATRCMDMAGNRCSPSTSQPQRLFIRISIIDLVPQRGPHVQAGDRGRQG